MSVIFKDDDNGDKRLPGKTYWIRDRPVMLDKDVAKMYGVDVKIIRLAVKRNKERFPEDFMIEMTEVEFESWRSQFASADAVSKELPFCFTEGGLVMLSCMIDTKIAIRLNTQMIKAFISVHQFMRKHKDTLLQLKKMKGKSKTKREEIVSWLKSFNKN